MILSHMFAAKSFLYIFRWRCADCCSKLLWTRFPRKDKSIWKSLRLVLFFFRNRVLGKNGTMASWRNYSANALDKCYIVHLKYMLFWFRSYEKNIEDALQNDFITNSRGNFCKYFKSHCMISLCYSYRLRLYQV